VRSVSSYALLCAIRLGLKIAIADVDEEGLNETAKTVVGLIGEANVLVVPTNVAKLDEVVKLKDKVYEAWGEVSFPACLSSDILHS
jgi:hypothetical protein